MKRLWAAVFTLLAIWLAVVPVLADNQGDVWVDNVGQPGGPGHEQDPHLQCADIDLWGSGLESSFGLFQISGWPPSGSQEVVYSAAYHGSSGILAVISAQTLVHSAVQHGDSPVNGQGFHFKLYFSQDPSKFKTFWLNCSTGGPTPGPQPTPEVTPRPTHDPGTPTPTSHLIPPVITYSPVTSIPVPDTGVDGDIVVASIALVLVGSLIVWWALLPPTRR